MERKPKKKALLNVADQNHDPLNGSSINKYNFKSFDDIWHGGYYEGDPMDPVGPSKYRRIGYISILFAIYQTCIRPFIHSETIALEIGPGRGAWTKTMLGAKEIWCLDAKSREDNRIDEFLGYPKNLFYHHVSDFSCRMLPDDTFTFMFSFGCFCHVPLSGVREYALNLFPKMKSGAHAFWMVADYEKRNQVARNFPIYDVYNRTLSKRIFTILECWNKIRKQRFLGPTGEPQLNKNEDQVGHVPGRWYHCGASETASMLEQIGYNVLTQDIGLAPRDVILHFQKP